MNPQLPPLEPVDEQTANTASPEAEISDSAELSQTTHKSGCGSAAGCASLVIVGVLIGSIAAFIVFKVKRPTFQSTATISIQPRFKNDQIEFGPIRHERFINSYEFAVQVLSQQDLAHLSSFDELFEKDAAQVLADNLVVQQDEDERDIFHLTYNSIEKGDGKFILNALIVKYEEKLKDRYRMELNNRVSELKARSDKLAERLNKALREYDSIRTAYPDASSTRRGDLFWTKRAWIDRNISDLQVSFYLMKSRQLSILDALEHGLDEEMILISLAMEGVIDIDGLMMPGKNEAIVSRLEGQVDTLIKNQEKILELSENDSEQHDALKLEITSFRKSMADALFQLNSGESNSVSNDKILNLFIANLELKTNSARIQLDSLGRQFSAINKMCAEIEDGQYLIKRKEKEIAKIDAWIEEVQRELVELDPNHLDQQVNSRKKGYQIEILQRPEVGIQVDPHLPRYLFWGVLMGTMPAFLLFVFVKLVGF